MRRAPFATALLLAAVCGCKAPPKPGTQASPQVGDKAALDSRE